MRFFQSTLLQEERRKNRFPCTNKRSFNPRSYKRSDNELITFSVPVATFNPRSYKRSDLAKIPLAKLPFLSIHAPTRGATANTKAQAETLNFQSTLLQEERRHCQKVRLLSAVFQSTLLQEERHPTRTPHTNPHILSIHAPTRGATLCSGIYSPGVILSIHAPTRGATFCKISLPVHSKLSIHAPTRGATSSWISILT